MPETVYRASHKKDEDHEKLFAHCKAIKELCTLLSAAEEVKGQGKPADGMTEIWRNMMRELERKAEGWREELMRIEKLLKISYLDPYEDQGECGGDRYPDPL